MRRWVADALYNRSIDLLIAARESAGLTQWDVALRLDKPQSFVSKYERQERRIDMAEYVEIARALQVDPAKLVAKLARL
jgi:transcriptional regulator with XRE-family HTH domain